MNLRARWDAGGHAYLLGSSEGGLLQLVVAVLGICADGHPWKTERSVVRRALWGCGVRGPSVGTSLPILGVPGCGGSMEVPPPPSPFNSQRCRRGAMGRDGPTLETENSGTERSVSIQL